MLQFGQSIDILSKLYCPFNEVVFFYFRDYNFLFLIFTVGSFLKVSLSLLKSLTSSATTPTLPYILCDIYLFIS